MPWTLQNPPPPAKNWSDAQKRRCVAAANAVLSETGNEQKAVFACIHAAGKSRRKQDEDKYTLAALDAEQAFKYLLGLYFINRLTRAEFEDQFTAALEDHFGRLMLLALGRKPTSQELAWLNSRITKEKGLYLEGFFSDLNSSSQARLMWRAGQYAWARDVYVRYTIPFDVAAQMPFLPGEDCLGRDRCRCWLTVAEGQDTVSVTWHLDPGSHNCEVCTSHAMQSPYIFPRET